MFIGDDWAEAHHDIEVQADDGAVLVRRRLPEGLVGMTKLHELVADHLDDDADPAKVVVGIETDRGPWVQALLASGYTVYPIDPAQAARYRGRHASAGAKSDPGDAHVLAEIVRLDAAHHRPIAGDSALAEQVKILARTHQSLVWSRQRHANSLRSRLREYYPAALVAFGDELAGRDALAVLAVAPSPDAGHQLTIGRIERLLRNAGRQRNLTKAATRIHAALSAEQLPALEGVVPGYAAATLALVAVITATNTQVEDLAGQVEKCFGQHPDAEILASQPGLGAILGARVLAEFGDDPDRYADVRARKNYSGMAPITRASGLKRAVLARHARNQRLADALYQQAFAALTASTGARAYYDEHRARGATHHAALRALANRLVGILHGCLASRTTYDENTAWAHRHTLAA
ncbi:MAG: IS110 family transposase [Dermatophilaceae bacterium]